MTIKNEKTYLFQLTLPFILLGLLKSYYFFIVVAIILFCMPFKNSRQFLIKRWMAFGDCMQGLVSPVVIGLIYFVVLTPLAVIRRLFSKNSDLKLVCPSESNFQDLEDENTQEHYKELW